IRRDHRFYRLQDRSVHPVEQEADRRTVRVRRRRSFRLVDEFEQQIQMEYRSLDPFAGGRGVANDVDRDRADCSRKQHAEIDILDTPRALHELADGDAAEAAYPERGETCAAVGIDEALADEDVDRQVE